MKTRFVTTQMMELVDKDMKSSYITMLRNRKENASTNKKTQQRIFLENNKKSTSDGII